MNIYFDLEAIKKIISDTHACKGNLKQSIIGIASLTDSQEGDLSFLSNAKYASKVPSSKASLILLPRNYQGNPNPNQMYIFVDNPSYELAQICRYIESKLWPIPKPGIHPTAFVEDSANIDPTASIGPFVYIGKNTSIGKYVVVESHSHIGNNVTIDESSWIMPHVSIMDYCSLGKRVRLHSMVVIGADGFGFSTLKDGTHQREPQIGKVKIADDVDIGAGTKIDRSRFAITQIGAGTKIDNLVQIGHNVTIGKHCLIVSQVGISGSTVIGDNVIIGGQVGIAGHLHIGDKSMIGAKTGIGGNVEKGSYLRGDPAQSYMLAQRVDVLKKKLPELFKRVDNLENEIRELQEDKSYAN